MARLEEENQRPLAHKKPEPRITKGLFVTVGLLLLNTVRRSHGVFTSFPCVLISGGFDADRPWGGQSPAEPCSFGRIRQEGETGLK